MTIISPSILSANFLELKTELDRFKGADDLWFHLDIMDGHFVPNLTFGPTVLKNISSITGHPLDAHLMVENPENYLEPLSNLNVHNFTFHWEACIHHDRMITELKSKFNSVGISLNPSTPLSAIPLYILAKIDLVLLMSVNPGFGGQSFIPCMFDKVHQLNELKQKNNYKFQIQVDGGINNTNSHQLITAGANNLVAGSYIFNDPNKDYMSKVASLR